MSEAALGPNSAKDGSNSGGNRWKDGGVAAKEDTSYFDGSSGGL